MHKDAIDSVMRLGRRLLPSTNPLMYIADVGPDCSPHTGTNNDLAKGPRDEGRVFAEHVRTKLELLQTRLQKQIQRTARESQRYTG
jgi:hypothetical protein